MVNLFGPGAFGSARPAAVRPAYTPQNAPGDQDDWFQDCTSPEARDGTEWRSPALNFIIANLRSIVRKSGQTANNLDDSLLVRSIRSQRLNYIAAVGGTANALTATLDPVPIDYAEITGCLLRIKTGASANTAAGPTLDLNAMGALPILRLAGTPCGAGDLPANTILSVIPTGTSFLLAGIAYQEVRRRLIADATFYVAPTGSDSNPGTSGSPWLTLAKAANYLQTQLDLNGFTVTINVANGTYTAGFGLSGFVPGQVGISSIQVIGNVGTPASCYINSSTIAPFIASNGAAFQIKGFQVASSSVVAQNGAGIYASTGGIISYESMAFNACAFSQVFAEIGGYCVSSGSNTINGNAPSHLFAKDSGVISIAGRAHTLSGGPTFSGAFAQAETGTIEAAAASFSGSATGPRYYANANGVIKTNAGGANFFPGSAAGSVNAGGQYV